MGDPIANSIFLSDFTIEEMNNIISSLNNGAAGWDEFTKQMIKEIRSSINSPLVHICNLSLQQGLLPDELKIANVLILFKACDPYVFNNYRPVSLMCVLSKVYERIMYNRLIIFLENYNILFENQLGFRKLHSPYMAPMVLIDKLKNKAWKMVSSLLACTWILQRPLIRLTMTYPCQNFPILALEGIVLNGFKVTYPAANNM